MHNIKIDLIQYWKLVIHLNLHIDKSEAIITIAINKDVLEIFWIWIVQSYSQNLDFSTSLLIRL